ncbi:MAG: PQQ-dependent sugar dehydrogenase [Microthrixaceae bacterium]
MSHRSAQGSRPARPTHRRSSVRHLGLAVLAGLVALAGSAGCAAPASYQVTTMASGLNRPWDGAFTPDGSFLYTERVGRIGVVRGGSKRTLATPSDVVAQGEGGMLGLDVDPNFATNRRIYTCFVSSKGGLGARVVRWNVSADWRSLTGRTDLLSGIEVHASGRHSGCRVKVGPDGALWVTTGDAAKGTNPQDRNSLAGKVLRMTTNGDAAAGNAGGPWRNEVYAAGFRNPQGLAFRPGDNQAFLVEHGPECDDEITPLRRGGNGGWNPVGGTYNEGVPMTDTRIANAMAPSWKSGCPTIAPSGAAFTNGGAWGLFNNRLAVAVLKGQHLRLHSFDPNNGNRSDAGTVILSNQGRLRTAVSAPDGSLWVLQDSSNGKIFKVRPVPGG